MKEPSAELIIDIDIIRNNIIYLKSLLNPNSKFMAVLKANAYGHGLQKIADGINDIVDGFGLVRIEEALNVRKFSNKKILLMQGLYNKADLDLAIKNNFDSVIHNQDQLFILDNENIHIWVKVNTGMNRLGFSPKEFSKIYKGRLISREFTLMSHLACSDNPSDELNSKQFDLFNDVAKSYQDTMPKSIANTGCILNFPQQNFDWVRSGIGLYGGFIGNDILETAMTFRSQIIEIKNIKKGDRIGYNGRVTASHNMKIAIVYAGYADGFPQATFDNTKISINNYSASVFGQVSMDLLSIDVTKIPQCQIGDWCIFWDKHNTIKNLAVQNNLISYELMTRITPRVKVIFKNQ